MAIFAFIIALSAALAIFLSCCAETVSSSPVDNSCIAVDASFYSWVWAKANYYSKIKAADL